MKELSAQQVCITSPSGAASTGGFWGPRLAMNAHQALFHQWDQLEASGCIENFRLLAEGKPGFREGRFFADSDAYKWLDAASRALAGQPSEGLTARSDALIALLRAAQAEDGYLFTYNQIHFPGARWTNLQIEHELYCHGHLIEAAVSHYKATGQRQLLDVAEKASDLLVREFLDGGPERTPGHEEIELALIKLYRVTGKEPYLALAQHFLEQRGRVRSFALYLLGQNRSVGRRGKLVEDKRSKYLAGHPDHAAFRLPAGNAAREPRGVRQRFRLSVLSGKYFQQHRPVREQPIPVGHSVRFAYLQTAIAMLYRERGDESLLPSLQAAWERMVDRRMYVTGGIGSLPWIEGFGRDFELDPEIAYAETCAALGCMFWNWEMALITREARYADLFEWQLYNAAGAGMGLDGRSYLYNNPLACRGGVTRQAWYEVPCCPSNLSRTWASLGAYLYSYETGEGGQAGSVWVHQYVSSEAQIDLDAPVRIEVESALPWEGKVRLHFLPQSPTAFTLYLRIPSWAGGARLGVNGQPLPSVRSTADADARHPRGGVEEPASGYSPYRAYYFPVSRTWSPGDVVDVEFPIEIAVRRADPRVRSCRGKVALTRGPLVYCLESVDNPGLDLFQTKIDLSSLHAEFDPGTLGGVWILKGETEQGQRFNAIPYAWWANRGESQMAVWLRTRPE